MAENKYDVGFNKFKNIYGELCIRVLQNVNETSPDMMKYIVELHLEKFIAEKGWILNQEK
jgi:hypothetical protein